MDDAIFQEIDELFRGKPFLTLADVTQLLGCSENVVYNWTKRANFRKRPPRLSIGKELRFPKREFIRWLIEEQGSKHNE